jgi:hypothetical protein
LWIKLAPPLSVTAGMPVSTEHTPAARPSLVDLKETLGCGWLSWAPDARTAWAGLAAALDIPGGLCVLTPFGADPAIDDAARERGAHLYEVDLDPRTGRPVWPPLDTPREAALYVVEHRYGLPVPPPPAPGALVIEDATAAVGGTVGGRPVGSLGRAAVVTLGAAPFARSSGAFVATNDHALSLRLAADRRFGEPDAAGAGLREDAAHLQDWIAGCRAAAGVYDSVWRGAGLPVRPVEPAPQTEPTWSSYLVSVPDAESLGLVLAARGVETRRPLTDRFARDPQGGAGHPPPGAREFHRSVLQLPNHPDLGLGELLFVADAISVLLRTSGQ